MIYENPIPLQVINSQAVGNGPRVLLVFAKVNMLKNDDQDIRSFMRRAKVITGVGFRWSEGTGPAHKRSYRGEILAQQVRSSPEIACN